MRPAKRRVVKLGEQCPEWDIGTESRILQNGHRQGVQANGEVKGTCLLDAEHDAPDAGDILVSYHVKECRAESGPAGEGEQAVEDEVVPRAGGDDAQARRGRRGAQRARGEGDKCRGEDDR